MGSARPFLVHLSEGLIGLAGHYISSSSGGYGHGLWVCSWHLPVKRGHIVVRQDVCGLILYPWDVLAYVTCKLRILSTSSLPCHPAKWGWALPICLHPLLSMLSFISSAMLPRECSRPALLCCLIVALRQVFPKLCFSTHSDQTHIVHVDDNVISS